MRDWRFWFPTADDLHFGVQVVPAGEHLYVFGSRRRGVQVDAILGRVPVESVADAKQADEQEVIIGDCLQFRSAVRSTSVHRFAVTDRLSK